VVRDGAEALDYLFATGAYADRDLHVLPQVVLLDLHLPKVSGLEVLQRLRETEHTRHLPVVILTSSDQEDDMLRSYDLGANSFVTKPVGMPQFTQAVQQLGLYWLLLNKVTSEGA
jgi:two-component system response regulator